MKTIRTRSKSSLKKQHRGGALYTFDLNDKVGGLPARVPLNGTADGDCPGTDTKDLGFVNYGLTRGGGRKRRSLKHKKSKKSHRKSKKSKKSKKSHRKH